VEVGGARLASQLDPKRFAEGQRVKLVFRPEDVVVSTLDDNRSGSHRLAEGVVEEINFVGAYERVSISLDLSPRNGGDSFYLTTETQEAPTAKPIIATRPKPEASATKLRVRDHILVWLKTFTVLPA